MFLCKLFGFCARRNKIIKEGALFGILHLRPLSILSILVGNAPGGFWAVVRTFPLLSVPPPFPPFSFHFFFYFSLRKSVVYKTITPTEMFHDAKKKFSRYRPSDKNLFLFFFPPAAIFFS